MGQPLMEKSGAGKILSFMWGEGVGSPPMAYFPILALGNPSKAQRFF